MKKKKNMCSWCWSMGKNHIRTLQKLGSLGGVVDKIKIH